MLVLHFFFLGEGSDVVNDILQASGKPHPVKGGVQVTPYLVIGW